MKKAFLIFSCIAIFSAQLAAAHCQIPCGIYDDEMRIKEIREHITTIEKSIKSIVELSGKEIMDYNNIVRWVNNKDQHADRIAEIVSYYFMSQRVKPVDDMKSAPYAKYTTQLATLHSILIYAVKAKQGTDLAVVDKLRSLVSDFEHSYLTQQ